MYRVSYCIPNSTIVVHREFNSLKLALDFASEQAENSVFEINVDKEYIKDLHNSNYKEILNSLEVLKTDYVYF